MVLDPSATTSIQLSGVEPLLYDSISGLSRLAINGELSVELIDGFALADNLQFQIFDTSGTASGNFIGLNEGALVGNFGSHNLYISYRGGDGNDVSLFTTTAVPEPSSVLLMTISALLVCGRRKRI